jgi:hypothetical protein
MSVRLLPREGGSGGDVAGGTAGEGLGEGLAGEGEAGAVLGTGLATGEGGGGQCYAAAGKQCELCKHAWQAQSSGQLPQLGHSN